MKMQERIMRAITQEYERDASGQAIVRCVEIPYRPEFVTFFPANSDEPGIAPVPWASPDPMKHRGEEDVEYTGELRGPMPEPIAAFRFLVDERAAIAFGFSTIDVSYVELPTLDYAKSDPLMMKVYVRVPKGK